MNQIARKKKAVRLRLDLLDWVEDQIEKGKFWNFSYAVEVALEKLRDAEKEK
jgi:Arc/MetJ-type ribon-helix-helix transcriptional regulator